MTLSLYVDAPRWRAHTERTRDDVRRAVGSTVHADPAAGRPHVHLGDLVPVAKGNGYGLGNARLAREAGRLGLTRIAVGTVFEVAEVAGAHDGDILVLTPFDPRDTVAGAAWVEVAHAPYADRVLRTVSSREAWDAVAAGPGPVRVVLEALTSMGRFGLTDAELADLLEAPSTRDALAAGRVRLEGLALHLPLAAPHLDHRSVPGARWHDAGVAPAPPPGATARVTEAHAWALGWVRAAADLSDRLRAGDPDAEAVTALTSAAALWVSHLDDAELAALRAAVPDVALYARIGTRLWLGDRGALAVRGTVLAVHEVVRGQASGYRQRRAGRAGAVVVVGGGTAHGIALEAPSPAASWRQRAVVAGTGLLDAAGRALSPFHVGGAQRWFAEPPHMHVSLLRLPAGTALPEVGEQVDVDVRMTTLHADRVLGLD
ncbi:MAG: alanine racemase [Frankiales bacterium]|nr:alanine racemase [Frankiales bacterium]